VAYSTIVDEKRQQGATFEDAVESMMEWAASVGGEEPMSSEELEQTRAEREEERIARQNAAAFGQIDAALRGVR
jgi:hypothetical protein